MMIIGVHSNACSIVILISGLEEYNDSRISINIQA